MSEKKQLRDALIKVFCVIAFATLYSIGGSEEFGGLKWLRRFVAPLILVGSMFWYSRSWMVLIQYPLCCLSLSLGYSSDFTSIKILKRLLFGIANSISCNVVTIFQKRWLLFILNIVIVTSSCVMIGVWSLLPNARVEEFVLGFLIAFLPIMGAKKKE